MPILGDLPINGRMFRANLEMADETKNLSKEGQGVTVRGRSSSSIRRTLDLAGENETVLRGDGCLGRDQGRVEPC